MMKYLPFLLHDNLASLGDARRAAAGRDFFLEQAAFPHSQKTVSAPLFRRAASMRRPHTLKRKPTPNILTVEPYAPAFVRGCVRSLFSTARTQP
jgi:hypothetical protein